VLLVMGCGSSALSAADLRKQAGLICSRADRQISRIPTPANQAAGNAFLKAGIAALDPELADLKALKPPSDEAVVYQAGLKALSGELDGLHSATTKLDQGADPVRTFRELETTLAPLETEADNAWRALDISSCLSR
jgi:hypothetical protein